MSVVVPLFFIAVMASLISAALRIPRDRSFMLTDSAARSVARYLFSPSGHPVCRIYPTASPRGAASLSNVHQLASKVRLDVAQSGRIAARAGQALDQIPSDWICRRHEDDWDHRGRQPSPLSAGSVTGTVYIRPWPHQFGRPARQRSYRPSSPTVLHHDISILDLALPPQPGRNASTSALVCDAPGTESEITDHRHLRLLRARRERPCHRRAAEQRDELATLIIRSPRRRERAACPAR